VVCAHEVAHLWFGSHVTMRWWDDLWLDEALATYLSAEFTGGWTAFCYGGKARAYRADELPVSSPVASSALALSRPAALTYGQGARDPAARRADAAGLVRRRAGPGGRAGWLAGDYAGPAPPAAGRHRAV
jgi:hypothetical protein